MAAPPFLSPVLGLPFQLRGRSAVRLLEELGEVGGIAVADGAGGVGDGRDLAAFKKIGRAFEADGANERGGRQAGLLLQAALKLAGTEVHLVGEPLDPETAVVDVRFDGGPDLSQELAFAPDGPRVLGRLVAGGVSVGGLRLRLPRRLRLARRLLLTRRRDAPGTRLKVLADADQILDPLAQLLRVKRLREVRVGPFLKPSSRSSCSSCTVSSTTGRPRSRSSDRIARHNS